MSGRAFNKPWLSVEQQVSKLISRGLDVADVKQAASFLRHVNYYRFSGYGLAFESERHVFLPGTTFDDIRAAYLFDVKLRDLMAEALEVVEIDFRANLAYCFGQQNGAFAHVDERNFQGKFKLTHARWLEKVQEECERSNELFVEHFRNSYTGFPDLPIWMATEIMSLGSISKMYSGLAGRVQSAISSRYNMQKQDLLSLMHHLTYVRNLCAHHSRLWDRRWAVAPRLPAGKNWEKPLVKGNDRVFVTLLLLYRMLSRCTGIENFATVWRRRINELFQTPPSVEHWRKLMGLTDKWYSHPYWV